jgi:hypothetical protein
MLKEILSISGQPGLFKLISKGKNSVIVESILTGKRLPSFASNKITSLDDIAIYTKTGEVALREVFKKIDEDETIKSSLNAKASPVEMKSVFKKILPDYDEERVYVSDIKKIISWFLLLSSANMLDLSEEPEPTDETKSEE